MKIADSKKINILFIGDIFGKSGMKMVENHLEDLKKTYQIDFVVAQSENVSGRKGLIPKDYEKLKKIGIDAFTLGNHVWAKEEILTIINNNDIIRPLNINDEYQGQGSRVFKLANNLELRITALLGISFNPLNLPWKQCKANNFFDAIDKVIEINRADFHVIDFHAETTSEKNVLALYLDGKVDGLVGTHTHVQTNDAKVFPNNLAYITDAGMTGPANAAIGANFQEVYEKMRYDKVVAFKASKNPAQFNGVVLQLEKNGKSKILPIQIDQKN